MITNLNKVPMEIIPGRAIDVNTYNIRHQRLHHVLGQMSRLMLSTLENPSNDTKARVGSHDVHDLWSQWEICVNRLDFAFENRASHSGIYDIAREINLPTYIEIASVRNVKLQAVLDELMIAASVILGSDSAGFQADLAEPDYNKMKDAFGMVEKVMTYWIGGKDGDRGIYAPAYERSGTILPDVDSDVANVMEPSADMRKSMLPDAIDTTR